MHSLVESQKVKIRPSPQVTMFRSSKLLIIISALAALSFDQAVTEQSAIAWSPELVIPTQQPNFSQHLLAPNHAYPSNNSTNSLLTGTITQDPLFDDSLEPWNSRIGPFADRKLPIRAELDSIRHQDLQFFNLSGPDHRPSSLPHPPATYFSFSDRLAPAQRQIPQIQTGSYLIAPRSSEYNSVWTDSLDSNEPSTSAHRVVSRQLADKLPSSVISSFHQLPEKRSQLRGPTTIIASPPRSSPWLKALAARIGRSPSSSSELQADDLNLTPRSSKVTFDDHPGQLDTDSSTISPSSKRDLSNSLQYAANLPLLYEAISQASESRNSRSPGATLDEDSLDDSLASSSRFHAYGHHHQVQPRIYAAFPAPYSLNYKSHPSSSRKGVEKSILVGVGSALISFLILSNIFLSLPLLAMFLIHFISGTNIFPLYGNNNQTPNNGNQNNGQQPTANGRKKRSIEYELLSDQVTQAISKFASKF